MSLAEIYDQLCEEADALLKKHNPCRWNAEEKDCARGTHGCCGGCPMLSLETGCTIKALACKLWVCPEQSIKMTDEAKQEFTRLWDKAQNYNLLTFRGCAKTSVSNAKRPDAKKRKYAMVHKYGENTHIFLK